MLENRTLRNHTLITAALLLLLNACTVRTVIPLDKTLSEGGSALLMRDGFSFIDKKGELDPSLRPYLRENGRVRITAVNGCGDFAYSFFAILTLGIFPVWCPVSMNMEHVDSRGRKIFFYKKYREEHLGWLMPIFAIFPAFEFPGSTDGENHEYHVRTWNQAIITMVNEMAEAEETLR